MNRNDTLRITSRIVWASALYDLLVTIPFATPFTASWLLQRMNQLHVWLGMPGAAMPDFAPMHLFFVSLMGSIVTLWALLRLGRPEPLFGAVDTAGRALFSLWMAWALWNGQSSVLAVFLVLELTWFFVQGGAILWWRNHHEHSRFSAAT
ncbi:hypothetical protein JY651_26410 [Pyxidicoccus parkwayensis]|jgi:hypothetical protein|uniref:Uncharacterized protein n=1 Tax=Pyxidicoccus parkwayensis TaxID=2813578 RepID=A0ABX7NKB2_9BACT|nr:hypothetical protein [Pyxidicoccus parkwaysis]QSQ18891.1 hypothetical protein JY651_26410 [Pyxidicoccus parkwaysis]